MTDETMPLLERLQKRGGGDFLKELAEALSQRMPTPPAGQHRWCASVLRGHYGYFGMFHNRRLLNAFRHEVWRI